MPLPFPVVVGVPRSGTTLLRLMLDAHPQLAIPPETGFLLGDCDPRAAPETLVRQFCKFPPTAPAWADFGLDAETFSRAAAQLTANADIGDVLRLFYRLYADRFDKPRSGDKTPGYLQVMPQVARTLPEARFIHIIRDGRDVALSWRQTWFAPSQSIPHLVAEWARQINQARATASELNYLEVRYDQLLLNTAECLKRICQFIQLPYVASMLDYHHGAARRLDEHAARFKDGVLLISRDQRRQQQALASLAPDVRRLGGWRESLSREEQEACLRIAGPLLAEFSASPA